MRAITLLLLTLVCGCGKLSSTAIIDEGNRLYDEKKYTEAIATYTRAITADPTNADAHIGRGFAQSMIGNWEECVNDLNEAFEIDDTNLQLLNTRAFAHLHTGDFHLARQDFRTMRDIDKDAGMAAQHAMTQHFISRARNEEMSEDGYRAKAMDYKRAFGIAPRNEILLYERVCTLFDLERYHEALKDLDIIIKIDGDISKYGNPHRKRAGIRRLLGDERGAQEDEQEAASRTQSHPYWKSPSS